MATEHYESDLPVGPGSLLEEELEAALRMTTWAQGEGSIIVCDLTLRN